jgi:hypothetical protein
MTNEAIFEVWAPPGGRWSPWVKPVLFACMEQGLTPTPVLPQWDLSWVPNAGEPVALVLDLPGARARTASPPDLPWPVAATGRCRSTTLCLVRWAF